MIQYVLMAVFCLGAIGIDQLTKFWVVQGIPLHATVPVWNGVFHLTYTQNTGAAFSSFEGQHWLFALVLLVFIGCAFWRTNQRKLIIQGG